MNIFFRTDKRQSFVLTTVTNGVSAYRHQNVHGLGWIVAGLFIVGDMAGGGLIAMPTAMVNACE
jgi:hypothetical protein